MAGAAWTLLAYTILVILWGAFVRATGAGAGCGNHWPLCNGEILPRAPRYETLVELSHRLTSGLLGLFVAAFLVAAFRRFPKGHAVRSGAVVSFLFVVSEALIGAGLVRFEWVVANDSQERVYAMAFHLVNTFFLLAAMALTAWHAGGEHRVSFKDKPLGLLALALGAVLLVGASGAVTALGDTLIFQAGLTPEVSPLVGKLVSRRLLHPSLAVATFLLVGAAVWSRAKNRHGRFALSLFALQLGLGALNVYLLAPVWMQIIHLAVSDVMWVFLVLATAEALAFEDKKERPSPARSEGPISG